MPDQDSRTPGDDEALLGALGTVLRAVDPLPDPLREAAKGLLAWRTVDADLARLAEVTYDSAQVDPAEARELAAVRGFSVEATPRHLVLQGPGELELELLVTPTGDGAHELQGQLVPAQEAAVAVRVDDRVLTAEADDLGSFRLPSVSASRVRLLLQLRGEPFVTPWLEL